MIVQTASLISKAEAARVTGLSYSTIVRLVRRGVLQEVWLADGMRPRLRLADVLELGERHEQGSP